MLTHCGSKGPGNRLKNHLKFMEILSDIPTTICPGPKAVFFEDINGLKKGKMDKNSSIIDIFARYLEIGRFLGQ